MVIFNILLVEYYSPYHIDLYFLFNTAPAYNHFYHNFCYIHFFYNLLDIAEVVFSDTAPSADTAAEVDYISDIIVEVDTAEEADIVVVVVDTVEVVVDIVNTDYFYNY